MTDLVEIRRKLEYVRTYPSLNMFEHILGMRVNPERGRASGHHKSAVKGQ
ncbi:hypothetical protein CBM2637_B140032 [Cupriavidus taiwanensis]|nr:hypothetical protein CBM2637_B140032 [Cupriavidus taiwanensis]